MACNQTHNTTARMSHCQHSQAISDRQGSQHSTPSILQGNLSANIIKWNNWKSRNRTWLKFPHEYKLLEERLSCDEDIRAQRQEVIGDGKKIEQWRDEAITAVKLRLYNGIRRRVVWDIRTHFSEEPASLKMEDAGSFETSVTCVRNYTVTYPKRHNEELHNLYSSQNIVRARNQREIRWLIFRPWRWRRYVPPKRRLNFNGLHGVISQKIALTTWFHVGFLHGLFFDPKDGGDIFLRNVGWLSTDYTALYARR
jgi:hypothetical protein